MPLHIKDHAATDAVRRLARLRNLSLTETVGVACEEALELDDRARPIAERRLTLTRGCAPRRARGEKPTRLSSIESGERTSDRGAHDRNVHVTPRRPMAGSGVGTLEVTLRYSAASPAAPRLAREKYSSGRKRVCPG
jgi:hypothetical protein